MLGYASSRALIGDGFEAVLGERRPPVRFMAGGPVVALSTVAVVIGLGSCLEELEALEEECLRWCLGALAIMA